MWSVLSSTTTRTKAMRCLCLWTTTRSPRRVVLPTTRSSWRYFSGTVVPKTNNNNNNNESNNKSEESQGEGVFGKIACIGTGKMAQAILHPLIHQGVQPAHQIMVFDAQPKTMQQMQETYGVATSNSIPECLAKADLVLCAVKPQNLTDQFFAECQKATTSLLDHDDDENENNNNNDKKKKEPPILLSVIAGKPSDIYERGGFTKIVRSMPNTPATIGQGMTVWSCTANLTAAERKKIRTILSSTGKSMYVDDESYIDMATSISGSGPAYIFMLMESMIDAGVHMGFPRDKAATLVYHTMLGSTLYAMETGEHPAILRNSVTSPNGTTASALYELENGRFRTVIKDAMWACYRRSLEMGNHDSNVGPGRHAMSGKLHLSTDSDDEDNDGNNSGTAATTGGVLGTK